MKSNILLFLIAVFIVLLNSCESGYTDYYVLVRTGEVTDIDTSGARFNGVITNETADSIIDHGFVWGLMRQPVLTTPDAFNVSLGKLTSKNTFTSFISQDKLETGAPSYVRAYVKTKKYVSYGAQVIFIYNAGDKSPVISGVYPDSLVWGTEIDIFGKNFSYIPENISVQMKMFSADNGYRPLTITESGKTKVTALLNTPAGKTDIGNNSELYITVNNKESIKVPVHFKAPVISSINPVSGFIMQSATIYGSNLGNPFVNYEVTLGGVYCSIWQSGSGYLKVLIPDAPGAGQKPLSVKFQGMTTTKENAFSVTPPEITSFTPKSGSALSFITVNFKNAPAGYKVYIGNVQVNPLPSSGTNYINSYTPDLPPGEYEVKISYFSLYHIAADKFTII